MAQRKPTPQQWSPGILPYDCAKLLRGLLTAHPCAGSKLARIHASHPSGISYTSLPLLRGPIHCASCAAKTKQEHSESNSSVPLYAVSSFSRLREKVPKGDEGFLIRFAQPANALRNTQVMHRVVLCW